MAKTPSKEEVKRAADRVDESRQHAMDLVSAELRRLYDSYFTRVQIAVQNSGFSAEEAGRFSDLSSVMDDLEATLADAGLSHLLERFTAEYPVLADTAARYFEPFGFGPSVAGVARETIQAWIDFTSDQLHKLVDSELIPPVRSALLQGAFLSLDHDALMRDLEAIRPGVTTTSAMRLVDDSFAQFQRAIIAKKAETLDLHIFHYLGPDDAITSDQCEAMLHVDWHGVEGMLFRDEITEHLHPWLERYGWDPLTGGGHPGCRHQWSPVTADYAEEQGFNLESKDRGPAEI